MSPRPFWHYADELQACRCNLRRSIILAALCRLAKEFRHAR